jgi:hypothetical protein
MVVAHAESIPKLVVGVLVLMLLFGVGIAHLVSPDRFLKRSGLRKGGEMLTDFNRFGFRFVGLAMAAFSGFVLYELLRDLLTG